MLWMGRQGSDLISPDPISSTQSCMMDLSSGWKRDSHGCSGHPIVPRKKKDPFFFCLFRRPLVVDFLIPQTDHEPIMGSELKSNWLSQWVSNQARLVERDKQRLSADSWRPSDWAAEHSRCKMSLPTGQP